MNFERASSLVQHMRISRLMLSATALLCSAVAILWWAAQPISPGDVYKLRAGAQQSGALLRNEPFVTAVPAGAEARLILYATTRGDGQAAVGSAIVVVPSARNDRPLPVLAWAHGTTGIVPGCAPSLSGKPFDNLPSLEGLLGRGWAVVATDYVGLGTSGPHAYLVGEDAARGILDAVRAARAIPDLALSRETVIWGHSQGGHAALFAAGRATEYAPDVTVLGVVAMAPATDLAALIKRARSTMFGKIVSSYVMRAYASIYSDVSVETYVKPRTRAVSEDISSRCAGGWETLVSIGQTLLLPGDGIFSADPTGGALGARLRENTPAHPIVAPVMIAQGDRDDLVLPDIQQSYVAARCAAGQPIEYRTYAGRDHVSLVAPDSPLGLAAIEWTANRFAGRPATTTC